LRFPRLLGQRGNRKALARREGHRGRGQDCRRRTSWDRDRSRNLNHSGRLLGESWGRLGRNHFDLRLHDGGQSGAGAHAPEGCDLGRGGNSWLGGWLWRFRRLLGGLPRRLLRLLRLPWLRSRLRSGFWAGSGRRRWLGLRRLWPRFGSRRGLRLRGFRSWGRLGRLWPRFGPWGRLRLRGLRSRFWPGRGFRLGRLGTGRGLLLRRLGPRSRLLLRRLGPGSRLLLRRLRSRLRLLRRGLRRIGLRLVLPEGGSGQSQRSENERQDRDLPHDQFARTRDEQQSCVQWAQFAAPY
jgi:hypothetical protein